MTLDNLLMKEPYHVYGRVPFLGHPRHKNVTYFGVLLHRREM